MKMTKAQLIKRLKQLTDDQSDVEGNHASADRALVAFINDPEVTRLYGELKKWYA